MIRLEAYEDDELDAQAYAAIEQHIERARFPEQYVEVPDGLAAVEGA